jgi:hypothetical protein
MVRNSILSLLVYVLSLSANGQPYFPVPQPNITEHTGSRIPRTMQLLQASTVDAPYEVRIMVYGQSISMQDWWKEVKRHLDSSYPAARIVFVNKAIGGFSTDRLKHTVENDVVSFYPDLILFHDYGNEEDYEKIIRIIRSRTTAEIALQTDHVAGQNQQWHDKHNNVILPALAEKYGLAVFDVRSVWKQYLKDNNLDMNQLMTDGVHLNDHGNYLMASIIKKYFSTATVQKNHKSGVSELKAGTDFRIRNSSIELPIYGNRVDLIWKKNSDPRSKVTIRVDAKKPSAINECFYYTRPTSDTTGFFLRKIGQPVKMELQHPVEEEWTMTITSSDSVNQKVGFRIKGSVTGEDGEGRSDSVFKSSSGRIIIQPTGWFRAKEFADFPWLRPGDVLKWQVKRMCNNEVVAQKAGSTTILQGLKNGRHEITLSGKGLMNVAAIRVYAPPLENAD